MGADGFGIVGQIFALLMHPEAAHGTGQRWERHWVPIPSCHIVCKCMHAYDSCSAEVLDACLWLKGKERRSESFSAAHRNQASIPADCCNLPLWPDANCFSHECWYFDLSTVKTCFFFFFFFKELFNFLHCIIMRGIPEGWQEPRAERWTCGQIKRHLKQIPFHLFVSLLLASSETQTVVPSWASNLATQMGCVLNKSDCSFPCKYVTSPSLNLESVYCFRIWSNDVSPLSLSFRGTQSDVCHLECVLPSTQSCVLEVFLVCQAAG